MIDRQKLTGWQAVAREIGDYTITDDMADSRGRVTPSEWCPNSQHDPLGDWLPAEAAAKEILRLRGENRALSKALEEREADMHSRIRAGYDKTVADSWRAANEKLQAEVERLRGSEDSLRAIVQEIATERGQGFSEIGLGGAYLAVVEILYHNDRLREQLAKLTKSLHEVAQNLQNGMDTIPNSGCGIFATLLSMHGLWRGRDLTAAKEETNG